MVFLRVFTKPKIFFQQKTEQKARLSVEYRTKSASGESGRHLIRRQRQLWWREEERRILAKERRGRGDEAFFWGEQGCVAQPCHRLSRTGWVTSVRVLFSGLRLAQNRHVYASSEAVMLFDGHWRQGSTPNFVAVSVAQHLMMSFAALCA